MSNIFDSYIPKFVVNLNKTNDDILFVSTSYFSPEGDIYQLDKRTVSPNVIQTTQSLNELVPDVSDSYPFKIVTPIEEDGSTLILSPAVDADPTASQHYYAPIYFERYIPEVLNSLERNFTELSDVEPILSE